MEDKTINLANLKGDLFEKLKNIKEKE